MHLYIFLQDQVTAEVNILKDLKAQYKAATGVEFTNPLANQSDSNKDEMTPTPGSATDTSALSPEAEALKQKIVAQGDKIRQLKSVNTAKVWILEDIYLASL